MSNILLYSVLMTCIIFNLGWWSRGMIPPLQGGDQEFKSPPAHYFISILFLSKIVLGFVFTCFLFLISFILNNS